MICIIIELMYFYNYIIEIMKEILVFDYMIIFFFFKQKTAYEMRISDWSSDVCSSDLLAPRAGTSSERTRDSGRRVGGSTRLSGGGTGALRAAIAHPRGNRRSGARRHVTAHAAATAGGKRDQARHRAYAGRR